MKKGLTLIEILVAAITLMLIVTSSTVTFTTMRRLSRRSAYRYTALNLAKDVLEFGESAGFTRFPDGFTLRYEYSTFWSDYRVTSYTNIDPWSDSHPFTYMGDIKTKGLVPKEAPNSVLISYNVTPDYNFYGELVHTVKITWRETPSDPEQKLVLGVLPIRRVNDQFRLVVEQFWWD